MIMGDDEFFRMLVNGGSPKKCGHGTLYVINVAEVLCRHIE